MLGLFKKRKAAKRQEEVLKQIGALTIMELNNSRAFRRKIEKTPYGKKLKTIVKF